MQMAITKPALPPPTHQVTFLLSNSAFNHKCIKTAPKNSAVKVLLSRGVTAFVWPFFQHDRLGRSHSPTMFVVLLITHTHTSYPVTAELVHRSTDKYHCRSMEGRWRATELYTIAHKVSTSGCRVTEEPGVGEEKK